MDQTEINPVFKLAEDFINHTGRSVFLTGKAGTGKTTFLKYIRKKTTKQTVVVSPTGVAAINAGGTTLHSFFQLPFATFVPGSLPELQESEQLVHTRQSLLSNMRVFGEKRDLFRELELLIIDEVSMLRCDLLDAVDAVLRHFRNRRDIPFGGVQVLYIGDLFQLPPVVQEDQWQILKSFYDSPFFFDARVIREHPPLSIELKKIYRQSDPVFIGLLNKIRDNELDEEGYRLLQGRYQPGYQTGRGEGSITLTTHNKKADTINISQLQKLDGKSSVYKAIIEKDFPEKLYPTESRMELKKGAQVMMIRNDPGENGHRFYNGKIGKVARLGKDKIGVLFPGEQEAIDIARETWARIRFVYDREQGGIREEKIGSFSQFPIRLAWAVTIHQSQGLTFEKAIVDAGAAFAPGQVYVALSRCTSLEGITLCSRIYPGRITTDPRVVEFSKAEKASGSLPELLQELKVQSTKDTLPAGRQEGEG